jgi:hypothetical protein
MAKEPASEGDKGRVVPFVRREKPRGMPPVEGLGKYAPSEGDDDYRQRMINNGLALVACVLLVIVGIWLANSIAEMRKNQDCVLSGRRGCTPVDVPPGGPK